MNIKTNNFHVQDISFCNKTADNVVDKGLKTLIIKLLKENYDINLQQKNYVGLNPKIIKNVSNNQHLLSLKSTGNPYYLFLVKINNENRCFFIDQKVKTGFSLPRVIHVNYHFDNKLFDGTILDGDLVRDRASRWSFIVSDLVVYCNHKLSQPDNPKYDKNILDRVRKLHDIASTSYQPDPVYDICPLLIRKYFVYSEFDTMVNEFMVGLPYQIKAICFHTLNNKYSNYIYYLSDDERENKIKENDYARDLAKPVGKQAKPSKYQDKNKDKYNKNSFVIFQLVKTSYPDVYDLYFINDDNQREKYKDHPIIKTMEISARLRGLFEIADKTDNVYIKCVYAPFAKKWKWVPQESVDGIKKPDNSKKIQKVIDNSVKAYEKIQTQKGVNNS